MTEDQIRAIKGRRFPNAPFADEFEMHKWIEWAPSKELRDAADACLIHRAPAFRSWISTEQALRRSKRSDLLAFVALVISAISLTNDFGVFRGMGSIASPEPRRLQSNSSPANPLPSPPASPSANATDSAVLEPMPTTQAVPALLPEPKLDTLPIPQE